MFYLLRPILFRTCRYFTGLCSSKIPRYFLDFTYMSVENAKEDDVHYIQAQEEGQENDILQTYITGRLDENTTNSMIDYHRYCNYFYSKRLSRMFFHIFQ